jgi:hypothetical protein
MIRHTRNFDATPHDDVYARLQAEGKELLEQRDAALGADPRSETYRQYVARMRAHIEALALYLEIPPPGH